MYVQVRHNKSSNAAVLYRVPIYDAVTIQSDLKAIKLVLNEVYNCQKDYYILGDFNLNNTTYKKLEIVIRDCEAKQIKLDNT